MADRIVVMNQGVIEQIGSPMDIYRHPASAFVADFVGSMNFLDGVLVAPGRVRLGQAEFACGVTDGLAVGDPVRACVRPEDVSVRNVDPTTPNSLSVKIAELDFLGSFCRATLRIAADGGAEIVADFSINLMRDFEMAVGRRLTVALPADRIRVFGRS
ncbi:MAG: TOBE domain-containing protein, partial [Rhodospirillales bacterium]|nr:TOBE domain-containing protein [Rhodospirillales bacterium]